MEPENPQKFRTRKRKAGRNKGAFGRKTHMQRIFDWTRHAFQCEQAAVARRQSRIETLLSLAS